MDTRFGVAFTYPRSDPLTAVQNAGVTRWYHYGLEDPKPPPEPPPPRIAAFAGRMACVLPATTNAAILAAASPGDGTYWLIGNEPNNGGRAATPRRQWTTRRGCTMW